MREGRNVVGPIGSSRSVSDGDDPLTGNHFARDLEKIHYIAMREGWNVERHLKLFFFKNALLKEFLLWLKCLSDFFFPMSDIAMNSTKLKLCLTKFQDSKTRLRKFISSCFVYYKPGIRLKKSFKHLHQAAFTFNNPKRWINVKN